MITKIACELRQDRKNSHFLPEPRSVKRISDSIFPSIPADDRLRREFCAIPTVFLVENSLERAFRRI